MALQIIDQYFNIIEYFNGFFKNPRSQDYKKTQIDNQTYIAIFLKVYIEINLN